MIAFFNMLHIGTLGCDEPGGCHDLTLGRIYEMLGIEASGSFYRIVDDSGAREAAVTRTAKRVKDLAWERESERYLALVERLAGRGRAS